MLPFVGTVLSSPRTTPARCMWSCWMQSAHPSGWLAASESSWTHAAPAPLAQTQQQQQQQQQRQQEEQVQQRLYGPQHLRVLMAVMMRLAMLIWVGGSQLRTCCLTKLGCVASGRRRTVLPVLTVAVRQAPGVMRAKGLPVMRMWTRCWQGRLHRCVYGAGTGGGGLYMTHECTVEPLLAQSSRATGLVVVKTLLARNCSQSMTARSSQRRSMYIHVMA